jgi:transposase-like protein
MATEKAAPATLQEAIRYFTDPDVCLNAAIALRWGSGPVTCPTCGSTVVSFIASRRLWRCRKIGTVMEDSPLGLDKWMVAIWLLANARNGISSYELHRAIGITQKSAWFMLHRIRLAMQAEDGGKLAGEVEVDETYIGGKGRNMHADKRARVNVKRGRSVAGKTVVMGLLERHGKDGHSRMRTTVLKSIRKAHLHEQVRENVVAGATVHSDALASYAGLDADYAHNVIDHAEMYVDGNVHTNGCENFWSLLKRAIKGTYVSIEPFHLFRYLDEQCFRFNNRRLSDAERFAHAASTIVGKRLTYKALIGKEMLESCAN